MRPSYVIAGPLVASALLLFADCAYARPDAPDDRREARGGCAALKPGDHDRTISVAGKAREYRLHVPPAGAAGPRPLVIVLHGGAGSGPNVQGFSLMDPVSDANGFIAAYPSGPRGLIGGAWEPPGRCGLGVGKGAEGPEVMVALGDEVGGTGGGVPKRGHAT